MTYVADVTSDERMIMYYNGEAVVDLKRSFIDSAGATHYAKAKIASVSDENPFKNKLNGNLKEKIFTTLNDMNVTSQKGLIEMFDATIGNSTVLMPFGGNTKRTETQVSVQKATC
ncbi:MAG: hypothetical protein L6U99_06705 [Clostridium sp.]|nr:MAG: hypothetical protein L6U99_06705 [Clostridium sp.]